jgi:hypothetical protein
LPFLQLCILKTCVNKITMIADIYWMCCLILLHFSSRSLWDKYYYYYFID